MTYGVAAAIVIPSFFIRKFSVERLSPSSTAAPFGPAITPFVLASTARM
jgi:hypothetical protein